MNTNHAGKSCCHQSKSCIFQVSCTGNEGKNSVVQNQAKLTAVKGNRICHPRICLVGIRIIVD